MTLIDKVLAGRAIRESIDEEFPEIDAELLQEVRDKVEDVIKDAGASNFITPKVLPYGVGFKVELKRNNAGLTNLENGLVDKFTRDDDWEHLDTDENKDGSLTLYFR